MAFKMKGSSLYGKVNLNRGGQANRPDGRAKSSAFQKDTDPVTKDSPAKLNPSYVTTYDADGKATEKMVADRHADAVEKSGKARGKDGKATAATVRRTGLSEAKHQMKGYDYSQASNEGGLTKEAKASDAAKTTSKYHTVKQEKAKKALEASKSDPKTIAEEKKQAQKFPEDVKDSVRLRNTDKLTYKGDRSHLSPEDEISARGKEATSAIEKKKMDARNKKQIKAKQNKTVQASDKKKSETKKKS